MLIKANEDLGQRKIKANGEIRSIVRIQSECRKMRKECGREQLRIRIRFTQCLCLCYTDAVEQGCLAVIIPTLVPLYAFIVQLCTDRIYSSKIIWVHYWNNSDPSCYFFSNFLSFQVYHAVRVQCSFRISVPHKYPFSR